MLSALLLATALAGAAPSASPDPVAERLHALLDELERDHAAPRALVPLIQLEQLEDELPDLARAGVAYARLAEDPDAHPEVRAYARFRLADVERSRGNLRRGRRSWRGSRSSPAGSSRGPSTMRASAASTRSSRPRRRRTSRRASRARRARWAGARSRPRPWWEASRTSARPSAPPVTWWSMR